MWIRGKGVGKRQKKFFGDGKVNKISFGFNRGARAFDFVEGKGWNVEDCGKRSAFGYVVHELFTTDSKAESARIFDSTVSMVDDRRIVLAAQHLAYLGQGQVG